VVTAEPKSAGSTSEQSTPTVRESVAGEVGRLWSALTAPGRTERCLLFTSALRREGVTELVAATAAYAVEQNPKVRLVVVETNWRHPRLAARLKLPPGPGLVGVVSRSVELDSALQSIADGRLLALPAGKYSEKQPLSLQTDVFRRTLDALKDRADFVLVDAAAVSVYPDATAIGPFTDGAVLVVRAGSTKRETVAEAQRRLELAGTRVLGVVLNRRSDPIPEFLYKRL